MLNSQVVTELAIPKAFYRPGEVVELAVPAAGGAKVSAQVMYLNEVVATLEAPVDNGQAILSWTPPATAPRGYGLDIQVMDSGDQVVATYALAFDVLDHWIQAPRYGFLSEFQASRTHDADSTMQWVARYHLNGLQFYDWQYRHEYLMPSTDIFQDVLGRELSMSTITSLIEAAHDRNIAAMPYTAIYGASMAFYEQHPDWALFRSPGKPYIFGDNFLAIMDPSPDSPWTSHLLNEFDKVLDQTAFDGIHVDQYGSPQRALNSANERVRLDEVFPAFIDLTAERVQAKRGDEGVVIFNAVGNYPVETVAPANQDAVYIEVWQPYRKFMDLHRLIAAAENLGGGKPVILAAYIPAQRQYNVVLANALIFASGGYHIELGEPEVLLANPYFPDFETMSLEQQAMMQRYYDFLVRYENVLLLDTRNTTAERSEAISVTGVETNARHSRQSKDFVAVITRQGEYTETFSLINLMRLDHDRWDEPLPAGPTPISNLDVQIQVDQPVRAIWFASPDQAETAAPQAVRFTTSEGAVHFEVPSLAYWTMIVVEYEQ